MVLCCSKQSHKATPVADKIHFFNNPDRRYITYVLNANFDNEERRTRNSCFDSAEYDISYEIRDNKFCNKR